MKLEIREDSKNYAAMIIKLPPKQKVEGLDKLVKVTVFGNDVLTQKDTPEDGLYIFFPVESQIDNMYLYSNNEYRHSNLNLNQQAKPGFFEDTGRVKAIKFKGIVSIGYIAPVSTLDEGYPFNWQALKEGDEFTDIDGYHICKKYKVVHQQGLGGTKESRYNKKLKRFDKLIPNQFRFHQDTSPLARNLHVFHPDDIIVITDKWHGTSAVFSNVLINKELTITEKIAKFFKINVVDKVYDNLYSSRSVVKNQYINKEATAGYYNEDIWGVVNKELTDKIEQGITLYGEIVGHLESGKAIQKGYDYGCKDKEHKFLVYRITYTKPDGNVIEFSWQQIKNYCKKYEIETIKEIYFGKGLGFLWQPDITLVDKWRELFFEELSLKFLEKDCKYCINKVPAEGIVVRRDGQETYSAYKLKAKRFLEHETKQLDKGEVNIEDEQVTT